MCIVLYSADGCNLLIFVLRRTKYSMFSMVKRGNSYVENKTVTHL